MLALGLRTDRILSKITRVLGRVDVEPPADLLSAWPWWLRLLTPESAAGYIVAVLLMALGLVVIRAGKWAKRAG